MSDYRTDKDGFPIEPCGRCAGTGTYPSAAWNGVCLGCNGSGFAYPKGKVSELAAQWANEHYALTHVTPAVHYDYAQDGTRTEWDRVQPGDQIRLHDEDWRTVAAVRPTARMVGETYIGADANRALRAVTVMTHITFTNGMTIQTHGEQWRRRSNQDTANARRAELVAQAVKAYERLLKTRTTRAATAAVKQQEKDDLRAANVAQLIETHPELARLVSAEYEGATGFMADMRAAVLSGQPSDKQTAAAVNAVRRDDERKQERAALVASGVTCPTGRLTVDAEVVWVDARDTDWGIQYRMRIRTADGWNAMGNVPKDLLRYAPPEYQSNLSDPLPLTDPVDWLKGRQVRITATFAPSDKYQLSGDFKRPTVKVLDTVDA